MELDGPIAHVNDGVPRTRLRIVLEAAVDPCTSSGPKLRPRTIGILIASEYPASATCTTPPPLPPPSASIDPRLKYHVNGTRSRVPPTSHPRAHVPDQHGMTSDEARHTQVYARCGAQALTVPFVPAVPPKLRESSVSACTVRLRWRTLVFSAPGVCIT